MYVKAIIASLFTVAQLYVIFLPGGSFNEAAWTMLIPLDVLIIGYYARKHYLVG